jgi:hypothetical protein
MELTLNAAWLLIAVSSCMLIGRRIISRRLEGSSVAGSVVSVIALGCVLAILFPVISLSDDLQEMQAAVVEVSPSRVAIKKFAGNDTPSPGKKLHPAPFLISTIQMEFSLENRGAKLTPGLAGSLSDSCLCPLCRAPPASDALQSSWRPSKQDS